MFDAAEVSGSGVLSVAGLLPWDPPEGIPLSLLGDAGSWFRLWKYYQEGKDGEFSKKKGKCHSVTSFGRIMALWCELSGRCGYGCALHAVLCRTALWRGKPGACWVPLLIFGLALCRVMAETRLVHGCQAVHSTVFLCSFSQALIENQNTQICLD